MLYRYLVISLFASLLIACGGAEDRKSAYLEKGRALVAEENYEKARLEFQNVLQIDPKDIEARFELAKTLEKLQNWQGSAGHYQAVLNEIPDHEGALLRLGELYLVARNHPKALEHAEALLAKNPDHLEALVLMGGVRARLGEFDAAKEPIEKALALEPHRPDASALLASIRVASGDLGGAEQVLRETLGVHPKETLIKTSLARILAQQDRADEAAQLFAELIADNPTEFAYRVTFAQFLTRQERLDKAQEVLAKAVDDFPDMALAKLAYGEFILGRDGYDAAAEQMGQYIAAEPQVSELHFALGRLYEQAQNFEKARDTYQSFIDITESQVDSLRAKSALALALVRLNDLNGARELADDVLSENPQEPNALTLRGTLLLNEGDAPGAIADLRNVLRNEPNRVAAVLLLSRAHLANEEIALAKDVLQRGVDANPKDMRLRLELANIFSTSGELDESLAAIEKGLETQPNNEAGLEAKYKIHFFRKEYEQARDVAEHMKTALANNPKGFHLAGLVSQALQDIEASVGDFESALDIAPTAVQPLSQLVKSYLALQRKDDAIAKLNATIDAYAEHFVAHNLLGEIRAAESKFDEAIELFETASEISPQWSIPYRNLAGVYVARDDDDSAISVLENGIEKTKGAALLLTTLASQLERTGRLDEAIAQYEGILEQTPDSLVAANNLAMLLIEYREDSPSWERARDLAKALRTSNQAAFLDTVGWIEYRFEAYAEAVQFLEKAVEAAPDAAILRYHLGMAYFAQGNKVQARDHLARAVEAEVDFKGVDEAKTTLEAIDAG
ncbi:MAG: tetratricopeptide repeat protein [Pseudomonadota bacterium]